MPLTFSTSLQNTLGQKVCDVIRKVANLNQWIPIRTLQRIVTHTGDSLNQLYNLLRDDSRWESKAFMQARNDIFHEIFFDPGLAQNKDNSRQYSELVKAGVLKVVRVEGKTQFHLSASPPLPLSDIVIGTSFFPETSSNSIPRCPTHIFSGQPLDKACISCLRAAIHVNSCDVFNHTLMLRSLTSTCKDTKDLVSTRYERACRKTRGFESAHTFPYYGTRNETQINTQKLATWIPPLIAKEFSSAEEFVKRFFFLPLIILHQVGHGWFIILEERQ